MKTSFLRLVLSLVLTASALSSHAGWLDKLKSALSSTNTTVATSTLTPDQMAGGLKEALSKGVEKAVASLGRENGFLTNLNVKIPMPEKLQTVEKGLRAVGQNQLAEDFVRSMNRAAEQAVPVAAGVFGDAIKQMSIADARSILAGPDDAATQFFRRTTQTNLHAKFYPIVQKATDQVGVTAQYKQMTGKLAAAESLGALFGKSPATKLGAADIDAYVTDEALDGLFKLVAEEEKNIRANPLARTSELLQKVFGSATK
ncbi:MAG TPA: DUF4197 domain-containing protein [Verrucomicrobiae bacterium]